MEPNRLTERWLKNRPRTECIKKSLVISCENVGLSQGCVPCLSCVAVAIREVAFATNTASFSACTGGDYDTS